MSDYTLVDGVGTTKSVNDVASEGQLDIDVDALSLEAAPDATWLIIAQNGASDPTKTPISGLGLMRPATYDAVGVSEQLVGLTATQLLTNKTVNGVVLSDAGASTSYLAADGTYSAPAGSGDVAGPGTSTDNAFARFDSTTGKILLDSVFIGSDDGSSLSCISTTNITSINMGTTDDSDTKGLVITGGGGTGSPSKARGGGISVWGNESANPGDVTIGSGDIAGSQVSVTLGSSTSELCINNHSNNPVLTIGITGNIVANGEVSATNLDMSNILINTNGEVPINQRGIGVGTTIGAGEYSFDRWKHVCASVSAEFVADEGMKFTRITTTGNINVGQDVEDFARYGDKEVTLSAYIKSNVAADIRLYDGVDRAIDTHGGGGGWELLSCTGTIRTTPTSLVGYIYKASAFNTAYITIKWMKLEVGGVATTWTPPDPAVELGRCERYDIDMEVEAVNGVRYIAFPTTMRLAPDISVTIGSAGNITPHGFELTHNAAATCAVSADKEL